jgi:uncharacterized repeat protein (TIGR03803 family)
MGAVLLLCAVTVIAAQAQTLTTLVNFDGSNGAAPYFMSLVQGADGDLYGVTQGIPNQYSGTVFKLTTSGSLTTLSDVGGSHAGMILGTDLNLYGSSPPFKMTESGKLTPLNGPGSYGPLLQASDGNFYGTTYFGGTNNYGTIFRMTPQGEFTTLYSFDWVDGSYPSAGLVQARDRSLWGTTYEGGTNDYGTIFRFNPNGSLTSFTLTYGARPDAAMTLGLDGNLYGTTFSSDSESGAGTIFKITPEGNLTTLYTLGDDGPPCAGLILGNDGNFYGTTIYGGSLGAGTVFRVSPRGEFKTIYNFNGTDGSFVSDGLVQATNGIFYGATTEGGTYDIGTLFSLDTGLAPFVAFVRPYGKVGRIGGILGQGLIGTTTVSFNGIPASFNVHGDTFLTATVPSGATTGYVTVTTPSGTLTSNVPFYVIP